MLGLTVGSIVSGAVLHGLLGAALGLLLGRLADPRWSAIPRAVTTRHRELAHAAYGAGVAVTGALLARAMWSSGWRWPTPHDAWHFVPAVALAIVGAACAAGLASKDERVPTLAAHARTILLVAGVLLLFLAAMEMLVDML